MTLNNIATNQMSPAMMRVASGNRINSAADDAAGLAIVENMTSQIRGLDQGTRNTQDMQALIRTAEGGLEGIGDNLNRIRELSLQAANGTLNESQRNMIQQEIGQLANEIQSTIGRVEFNGQTLLNQGADLHTASSADGTGATVRLNDMTALAQAVADFNVVGLTGGGQTPPASGANGFASPHLSAGMDLDLDVIDRAIQEVNTERANLGAMHNRMDSTIASNNISSENLSDARSRIRDADIALEMMAVNQERVINEMQILVQRQEQDRNEEEGRAMLGAAGVR